MPRSKVVALNGDAEPGDTGRVGNVEQCFEQRGANALFVLATLEFGGDLRDRPVDVLKVKDAEERRGFLAGVVGADAVELLIEG